MATALLGLATPTTGTQAGTWGDTVNNEVSGYLDNIIAGVSTIPLSASNILLTAAQARNQMLVFTGTLLANVQISPDAGVLWNGIRCVQNNTTGNFSVTLTNGVGSAIIPRGRIGLLFLDATYGTRFVAMGTTTSADTIPAGYPMPFYSAAPPVGWTQDTSLNDYGIRITSSTGGSTGGSVPFSTLFGRTATDPHTLTIAEMPSHPHNFSSNGARHGANGINVGDNIFYASDGDVTSSGGVAQTKATSSTGGGGSHDHNIDMRLAYANFILATHG